jgi:hypothetical protein
MTTVAQTDHRDAPLLSLNDAESRREFADDLAKAAIAVDDGERVGIDGNGWWLIRPQPACTNPFEIFSDADDAVRIVAGEIRIHEPPRDRRRLVGCGTAFAHDRRHERYE